MVVRPGTLIGSLVTVLVAGVCGLCRVYADESSEWSQGAAKANPSGITKEGAERLPPVLPGQEVQDSAGNRMKVWSSSGGVPVAPAPEPFEATTSLSGGGRLDPSKVGVIVDNRALPRELGGARNPPN